MAQGLANRAARLPPVAVAAFLLMNLVPLAALLPGVRSWSGDALPSYALLPVVILPTVVLATHSPPLVYRVQLVIASTLCAVTIITDSRSASVLAAAAISTIGTLIFTAMLIERSRHALAALWADLHAAGVTDALTGALNRRGAVAQLPSVTRGAVQAGLPVGVAAIDLDHFKRINDEYGHAVGDEVLGWVCRVAWESVGESGLVVRSGGEELVLLTVGDPRPAAEALRSTMAAAAHEPRVTVSVGLVRAAPAALRGNDDLWAAVGVADLALYRAKAAGRDRIVDGGGFFGASADSGSGSPSPDEGGAGDDDDAARALTAARLFTGFGAAGSSRWRQAVERAKRRRIDPSSHRLYRWIVGWMMFVGTITAIQQAVVGALPAVQVWVILPAGLLLGGTLIAVMRRMVTSWAITPLFLGGSVFELLVVFGVGPESRPAALMLSLLVWLLVVLHWPYELVVAQMSVAVAACIGAAIAPGRPLPVAVTTAVSLVAALAMVASQRRREDAAEVELRARALTDPLTGLGNRRALQDASRLWPVGYIAMIDVDSFKALNDRFGHGRGDAVLRALALDLHAVAVDLDATSRVFRIGGDEFVIAGPGPAPDGLAARIGNALRAVPVTVSTGVAEWTGEPGAQHDLWDALALADRKMFGRKRARQA